MARKRRFAVWVLGAFAVVIAVVVVAVFVLTRTRFGVERVGRYVLSTVTNGLNGDVRIGTITSRGGLLGGVDLHDVTIHGPDGRPFLDADSVDLSYDWRTLVGGRVIFDRMRLYRPRIIIEMLPGDTTWNFARILAGPPTPQSKPAGQPQLIVIGGMRIIDGSAIVRFPFEPDATTFRPSDAARMLLTEVPGGMDREFRFQDLQADLPRLLVSSPSEEGRLFEIGDLDTRGYVWDTPFDLRGLHGTLTLRDSLVSFDFDRIQLPESRFSAVGRVTTHPSMALDVELQGSHVTLSDMQWLSPDLPDRGSGQLTLRIRTVTPQQTLWYAHDMSFTAPGTHVTGSVGIVTGDSSYFTQADLRAEPLDLEVIDSLIPGNIPMQGLKVGSLRVQGPGS